MNRREFLQSTAAAALAPAIPVANEIGLTPEKIRQFHNTIARATYRQLWRGSASAWWAVPTPPKPLDFPPRSMAGDSGGFHSAAVAGR